MILIITITNIIMLFVIIVIICYYRSGAGLSVEGMEAGQALMLCSGLEPPHFRAPAPAIPRFRVLGLGFFGVQGLGFRV